MTGLYISIVVGFCMMAFERVYPGTALPQVSRWLLRAISFNVYQVVIVVVAGYTWNVWLQGTSLLQMSEYNLWLGALLTYVCSTFIYYWWHRIRHESRFWWRFAHQIHHSASRLEILTSFYKHPLEIWLNSVLSAGIVYPLMGCSVEQGTVYTLLIAGGEFFYHWNVRTPRWVGHLIQRPESHRIHHQRGMHTKNYGDLPIFDKMFGTFSNPKNADRVKCGFDAELECSIGPMLLGREIETKRRSEPLPFSPACWGCHKKHRCEKERTGSLSD